MLQDNGPPLLAYLEGEQPRPSRGAAATIFVERIEVATGEEDIEPFHSRPVIEEAVLDALLDQDGDLSIQRGEVSEPGSVCLRFLDHGGQALDDLIDGSYLLRHGPMIRQPVDDLSRRTIRWHRQVGLTSWCPRRVPTVRAMSCVR